MVRGYHQLIDLFKDDSGLRLHISRLDQTSRLLKSLLLRRVWVGLYGERYKLLMSDPLDVFREEQLDVLPI